MTPSVSTKVIRFNTDYCKYVVADDGYHIFTKYLDGPVSPDCIGGTIYNMIVSNSFEFITGAIPDDRITGEVNLCIPS
jgi:hypothetical protein